MTYKSRAQWGDAQYRCSSAETYLQKAISLQKLHNLNLKGEGRGRERTISTHTHRQTTSFYFWFKSRGYVHSTLLSKVKVPQVFARLFPTTFMGEYLHVKDFLNPFKFSSWYLLQRFGYAVMCEWTCSRNRSAPAPALCYFDIDSDIFASQQRNVTKVTFCYEIWHT